MNHLYWLSQIQALEQSLVGEEVFILSQLLQQDYPIIPGFVVSNTLFRKFLANIDDSRFLVSNVANSSLHLDIDDYQVLQSIAHNSRQAIAETELLEQWQEEIVTAAQQLNSQNLILRPCFFPNHYPQRHSTSLWNSQTCFCDLQALTLTIKKVWSQLFSAKSLLYWFKLNLPLEEINCNVLIQPLENAIASGILELKPTTLLIQSTWGLPDSLERGAVEPDTYLLDRTTGKILQQKLGQKTRAYRLQSNQDSRIDCIESYFLTEFESETYSLTSDYLTELVNLVGRLIKKRPEIRYLEWTLSNRNSNTTFSPQFFWTRLNYFSAFSFDEVNASPVVLYPKDISLRDPLGRRTTFDQDISTLETSIKPLLTGLGVSPGKTTANILVNDQLSIEPASINNPCILVTKEIAPTQVALSPKIWGIIAETGGMTSHAAIIARELGIPAIVNAKCATSILKTGDLVMLDGDRGEVHHAQVHDQPVQEQSPTMLQSVTITEPLATRIMVNLSHIRAIERSQNLPIDGVGLLRGELLLLELLASKSLDQWLSVSSKREFLDHLTQLIRQFVVAFHPRPVFYRSVDWHSSQFNYSQALKLNPIVGDRGTYHHMLDSTLLDLELEAIAIIQQEGYGNINLILPFVRSVKEFTFCRERVNNFALDQTASFQLWIMAEVPSVVFLLPEYIQAGLQGILIGANDLTQLILGVDREHSDFSRLGLNVNHPAVLDSIFQLSQTAKKHHLPCAIAIHNPIEYPNFIDKLIEWDISIISVESEAVIPTYQAIARSEKRLLLNIMRNNNNIKSF
ncbi:MAG: PEP/pyruvate-binding domain-containing protein [Xenococcaceae cyanobacterium MO_167.B52]|nr:PEP/pyruvate-binding domain-containing protein [Xenococcaceae cyanobacterium MO_167.B52]